MNMKSRGSCVSITDRLGISQFYICALCGVMQWWAQEGVLLGVLVLGLLPV